MNKYIKGFLVILLTMIVMAVTVHAQDNKAYWSKGSLSLVAGDSTDVTLIAEIPAGKTLAAYSFAIIYDNKVLKLTASEVDESAIQPSAINNKGVKVKSRKELPVNSFSIQGVTNDTEDVLIVELVNVNVEALEVGTGNIDVRFEDFGASAADNFLPEAATLVVDVIK